VAVDAERFFEFRDEFDRAAQRYEQAASSGGEVRGVDPSGNVSAARSGPNEPWRIEVGSRWKSSLAASELSQAVLTAMQSAAVAAAQAWAGAVAEGGEEPRNRPLPRFGDTPAGRLEEALRGRKNLAETEAMLERLVATVDSFSQGIEETFAVIARREGKTPSNAGGGVVEVAALASGAVTRINYDQNWLESASPEEISRRTTEAIADSVSAASRGNGNPFEGTPLEEYGALVNDPDALRRLMMGEG
jgi:DNA-binding protein YbaB